jgi:hypothetical protein
MYFFVFMLSFFYYNALDGSLAYEANFCYGYRFAFYYSYFLIRS